MKQVNVGILGATGAVGQEMIKILEERNFPVSSLRPIASARSAGSKIMFRGQECTIVEASDDAFEGLDIVLGAAENDIAERFAPSIVKAGAVFVDNSSAFRLDPNVPLVIPEINPEDVKWHKGIISNPNCTTIVTLVAINALAKESPIETIIASSYQAVSGAGKGGIDELNNEVKALSEGKHLEPKVFQYQIAYNIIPQIGGEAFEGLDLVLGAAENDIAKQYAPAIVKAGAVFVDNSSAFRLDKDVPLVIPEINPEDVKWHKGIISNPNCTTIVSLVAINALNQLSPIESIVASSYQAVSGAGAGGPIELMAEVDALSRGESYQPKVFQYQIAYNVIPQIGGEAFEGYTSEEMKMQNEGRKIMHLPELKVSCTCVRVPVVRSHSVSIVVRTKEKISVERARELIAAAPGCKLVDDLANKRYPMPLETSDQDLVFVGRIRDDLTSDNGLNIWCCGDQVRKGAATNAVQIAQLLIEE